MNRRSFLRTLLAAPVAAVMGWKSKLPDWPYYPRRIRWSKPAKDPILVVHESTLKQVREMCALGEEMGSSYKFVKSRTASEIMARIDRREIRKCRRS